MPYPSRPAPDPTSASRAAGLAILMAAVALAGCGGGGGAGAPAPVAAAPTPAAPTPPAPSPGPGPAPASAAYHVFGVSSSAIGINTLKVMDPAQPATVVLSVDIDSDGAVLSTSAGSVNAGTRTSTLAGAPLAFFIQNRQLFQVALAKPGTPAAVRVSSLADVCRFDDLVPLDASGLDAWLVVRTAGADGDCDTATDNRQAFVRSGSSSSTAATLLGAGVSTLPASYVADNNGRLQWILAVDASVATASKLVAFNPALVRSDVTGGASVQSASPISVGASLADGVLMRVDGSLRRLSGSSTSLSLAAANYSFGAPFTGLGAIDGSSVYLADGEKILRVQGAAAPTLLATLPAGSGDVFSLTQTSTHLLVVQSGVAGVFTSTISKAGGTVLRLLSGSSSSTGSVPMPAGLDGNTLFYVTGSGSSPGELRHVQTDGSADTLVASGVYPAGAVLRTAFRADFTQPAYGAPVGTLYCQPAAGAADCRSGKLVQFDLASRTAVDLGSFSGSFTAVDSAPAWLVSGIAFGSQPGAVATAFGIATPAVPGYSRRDLWLFNPGQAASLTRVTGNMP